jgi:hypothetical protein
MALACVTYDSDRVRASQSNRPRPVTSHVRGNTCRNLQHADGESDGIGPATVPQDDRVVIRNNLLQKHLWSNSGHAVGSGTVVASGSKDEPEAMP